MNLSNLNRFSVPQVMIAYGSDVPFKFALMRFLAANNSNWKIQHTSSHVNKQEKIHYIKPISNPIYTLNAGWKLAPEPNHDHKILFTLIKYAKLVWESPFNWPIYKIRAELHVKQVKNYSMKQVRADCNQQNKNIDPISVVSKDKINLNSSSMT